MFGKIRLSTMKCVPSYPALPYCAKKWPSSKRRQLDFKLEFEELYTFSEGSCKSIKDNEVMLVIGDGLVSN